MLDLCMNCMSRLENHEDICPHCQEPRDAEQPEPFLPKKKILGERYIIGNGIKKDPEGLSYVGYDFIKNSKVYIREFFPSEICYRSVDCEVKTEDKPGFKNKFKVLNEDFLKYFRGIARFRNLSCIASVYDILEQNGTSYIILEWVEGTSLDEYLSSHGEAMSWKQARSLFMPLISPLSKMSSAGIHHLGLAPCNIMITNENKIKLVGFATANLRTNNNLESSELFEGCSALEQYIAGSEISESTDVYGFAATLFFALTGEYPLSATERKKKDRLLMPSNIMKELPDTVISAIANALRVHPNSRTISFEVFRLEISNSPVLQVKNIYDEPEEFEFSRSEPKSSNNTGKVLGIISCVLSLVILSVCFGVYWFWIKDKKINSDTVPKTSETTVTETKEETEETGSEEEKIDVPQLVGKSLSAAKSAAASANNYSVVVLSEEFHDTISEGNIISQTPNYGEKMYSGSIIAVTVSKGPSKRKLPNIEGKKLSEAALILTNEKFKPIEVSQSSQDFAEGTVIGYQDHKAGDVLDYGAEVYIVVSKG